VTGKHRYRFRAPFSLSSRLANTKLLQRRIWVPRRIPESFRRLQENGQSEQLPCYGDRPCIIHHRAHPGKGGAIPASLVQPDRYRGLTGRNLTIYRYQNWDRHPPAGASEFETRPPNVHFELTRPFHRRHLIVETGWARSMQPISDYTTSSRSCASLLLHLVTPVYPEDGHRLPEHQALRRCDRDGYGRMNRRKINTCASCY